MKKTFFVAMMAMLVSGLQLTAKELHKIVFKVEQMECGNCENKVKKNISFEKGVKKLETDLKTRTVTVTYDAEKTDIQTLKEGFAKFKYEAKVISDVKIDK